MELMADERHVLLHHYKCKSNYKLTFFQKLVFRAPSPIRCPTSGSDSSSLALSVGISGSSLLESVKKE